jgi:hypothetical protein
VRLTEKEETERESDEESRQLTNSGDHGDKNKI